MDYDNLKESVNKISMLTNLLYEAAEFGEETVKVLVEVIQEKINNLLKILIK